MLGFGILGLGGFRVFFACLACLPVCLSVCLNLSVHLAMYPSIRLSIDPSVLYPSVCLFICLSMYRPIHSSIYLSVHLPICLFACLPACLSVCLSVYLSDCVSDCLTICLSICLFGRCICVSVFTRRRAVALQPTAEQPLTSQTWVLVKGFNLRYHNKETILFAMDPCYGTLNLKPYTLKEPL